MPKEKTTEEITALILSVGRAIRKQSLSEDKRKRKLSVIQIETLRFIRENKKVLMKDLAEYLFIAPPSATSIADELFRRKLVARSADRKDRRIIKIALTAKGRKTLENSIQGKLEWFRKKIETLSSREKKSLRKILEKLAHDNIFTDNSDHGK